MINLFISETYQDLVDGDQLERAAWLTLQRHSQSPDSDLSIAIEVDDHLRNLNKLFLGFDSPTDVLSFPSGGDETDPDTGRNYLGVVIISYPRAEEQALAGGHSVMADITAFGSTWHTASIRSDHAELEEKHAMWASQRDILSCLGVQLSHLPE